MYLLFCLARPALERGAQAAVLRTAAGAVHGGGGLLTGLTSFGDQRLAYPVRMPGAKYEEVRPPARAVPMFRASEAKHCKQPNIREAPMHCPPGG